MKFGQLVDWYVNPVYFQDIRILRKARLLVSACLLTSMFSMSYVILSLVFDYDKGMFFTGFNVIGYFILPFLVRARISLGLLGNIFTAIGAITVLVLTWFSGGLWSAIYPWIIAIPVLALLVVGRTSAIYWSVFSLAWMLLYGVLDLYEIKLPVEYNESLRSIWFVCILPGLLLIIMVVSFTFENSVQRAMRDVESQNVTIEQQSAELRKLIEEKDHIIRILAHDLRNPLSNIGMLSKLLEKDVTGKGPRELVDMIGNAAANAEVLVKRVLEMAMLEHRDGSITLSSVDLLHAVNEVTHTFQPAAGEKGIVIRTTIARDCFVMADHTYLRLVFENLISNAIKFSPAGKKITISAQERPEGIQIRVRDYGVGVPPNEEDMLFKKFSRLSVRPTAGESSSGLGLSLVKRYMEFMNGRVWYERPDDGGSIFAIELLKW